MNELEEKIFNILYKEYGSMSLSKKEAAKILGKGLSTMDKERANKKGCPYNQIGNGNVTYNLITLIKFMLNNEINPLK